MITGLVLGAVLAIVLIAMRRRSGPLTHRGHGPGAHSMFPIEDVRTHDRDGGASGTARRTATVPALM
jgi:hypothetical protein